jgi:restriction endonuclease Mrr
MHIISADFKPNAGNAVHDSFKNYKSPESKALTPGLLLELFVTMIFEVETGHAERVGQRGDEGIGVWIGKNKEIVCQVKNKKKLMEPAVVREFLGTMLLNRVDKGYIVYTQESTLTAGVTAVIVGAKAVGYIIEVFTLKSIISLILKHSESFDSRKIVDNSLAFDNDPVFDVLNENTIESIENEYDALLEKIDSFYLD